MRTRFVLPHRKEHLLKLQWLHQGLRTVKEYFEDFETTLTKINMPNSDESKITMFVSGLRREIRDVVEVYEYYSLKKLVHLAIKVESQILKKTTFKNTHSDDFYKSSRKDANNIYTKSSPSHSSKEITTHQKVSKDHLFTFTTKSPTKTSNMKCFKCLGFGHIAANCPTKRTKLATNEQIKIKTKRENENEKSEESDKGFILLDLPKIIAPSWYTSSFSFSFPRVYTYLLSFLKNFRDDFQTPPKGFHLLRGFSSQRFVIPKHSFQTWSIKRTPSYTLPTLQEHKLNSHPNPCTILYVNKLCMLSAEVLNLRSNSLKPGEHDTNQDNKKMTKDANYERSSQHSSENLTRGRNGQRPEHLKFFLLLFLRIKQVVNNSGSLWGSK